MATTLVVNPGSSSKKYSLHKNREELFSMRFESTGRGFTSCIIKDGIKSLCKDISETDFYQALLVLIEYAVDEKYITDSQTIDRVGIRIVAPGTYFTEHRVIDDTYIEKLENTHTVASLHVPVMLQEIRTCKKKLPKCVCVGVSDSAFHTTIPDYISSISIKTEDSQNFDIKKFGYHGLSMSSVVTQMKVQYGKIPEKVIVCHVGSGVSVTAIQNGKSIATSMGYTPVSGLMMGTRSGDMSADVLAALALKKELRTDEFFNYLYTEGGFKGITGVSDFRLVLDKAGQSDDLSQKAIDMFAYQLRSFIGAYSVLLEGIDSIVLTATAVERNSYLRSLLLSKLTCLGVHIDSEKNELLLSGNGYIHSKNSNVDILVLRTNETIEILEVVDNICL